MHEKQDESRTSLLVETETNSIVGYYTILLKTFYFQEEASNKDIEKITGSKKSEFFTGILIGQLGRADKYKGVINGDVILKECLQSCEAIYKQLGCKVVMVEYKPIPYLQDFYTEGGFKTLQKNANGRKLGYLRLSK